MRKLGELMGLYDLRGKDFRGLYILGGKDGHEPVPVTDSIEWAEAFKKDRCVGEDFIVDEQGSSVEAVKRIRVVTSFIGIDHNFGSGPPLVFESMVFGGPMDDYQDRYSTWVEAEVAHYTLVRAVLNSLGHVCGFSCRYGDVCELMLRRPGI